MKLYTYFVFSIRPRNQRTSPEWSLRKKIGGKTLGKSEDWFRRPNNQLTEKKKKTDKNNLRY